MKTRIILLRGLEQVMVIESEREISPDAQVVKRVIDLENLIEEFTGFRAHVERKDN